MRVRAIQLGYYGDKRRRPGEEFDLVPRIIRGQEWPPEKQFSKNWMERVDGQPAKAAPVQESASEEPKADKKKKRSSVI